MKAELSKLLKADPQLSEALKILKSWDIFRRSPATPGKVQEAKLDQQALPMAKKAAPLVNKEAVEAVPAPR